MNIYTERNLDHGRKEKLMGVNTLFYWRYHRDAQARLNNMLVATVFFTRARTPGH